MIIPLEDMSTQQNSELFQKTNLFGESLLMVEDNQPNLEKDSVYGKTTDELHGKVYLFEKKVKTGKFQCDLQFLQNHLPDQKGGWIGLVFHAQDCDNYELVWLMPHLTEKNVASLSAAHSLVPWWSEGYETQHKGTASLDAHGWNTMLVDLQEESYTITVNNVPIFTKQYCYYPQAGFCGIYVGTGTDAAFKNFTLQI